MISGDQNFDKFTLYLKSAQRFLPKGIFYWQFCLKTKRLVIKHALIIIIGWRGWLSDKQNMSARYSVCGKTLYAWSTLWWRRIKPFLLRWRLARRLITFATRFFAKRYHYSVFVEVHLDETTPHLHLGVVPINKVPDKGCRLSAKTLFDRKELINLSNGFR